MLARMKKLSMCVAALASACGGNAGPAAPPPSHPQDAVVVTTSPVAPSAPLFTGAFEVESMSDGKETVVIADVLRKAKLHDGRMTYEIGKDKFKIGMWTISELRNLADSDDPSTAFANFCRASGEVSAHWEGSTLVLGSTIVAQGSGGVVRVIKKSQAGQTTRNQSTRVGDCSASFTDTRIAFEVLDKDESGPTRVRGSAPGMTLTLVRGTPISAIEPAKLFESK